MNVTPPLISLHSLSPAYKNQPTDVAARGNSNKKFSPQLAYSYTATPTQNKGRASKYNSG